MYAYTNEGSKRLFVCICIHMHGCRRVYTCMRTYIRNHIITQIHIIPYHPNPCRPVPSLAMLCHAMPDQTSTVSVYACVYVHMRIHAGIYV